LALIAVALRWLPAAGLLLVQALLQPAPAPLLYGRRSRPGPAFYIGGHFGCALFSSDSNFHTGLATGNNGMAASSRCAGRRGLAVRSDWESGAQGQYSWVCGHVGAAFPGDLPTTTTHAGRSVTGRVGYNWCPGPGSMSKAAAYSTTMKA